MPVHTAFYVLATRPVANNPAVVQLGGTAYEEIRVGDRLYLLDQRQERSWDQGQGRSGPDQVFAVDKLEMYGAEIATLPGGMSGTLTVVGDAFDALQPGARLATLPA